MSIKVIIERKFKEAPSVEILRIIDEIRIKVLRKRGYIGGETIVNIDSDHEILVISLWSTVEDWNTWYETKEWKELEKELAPHLDGPVTIRVFMAGADYEKKPSAK